VTPSIDPARFASPSEAMFYTALSELPRLTSVSGEEGARFVAAVARHLAEQSKLAPLEQAGRLQRILGRFRLDETASHWLAVQARDFPANLKNALAPSILPAHRRAFLGPPAPAAGAEWTPDEKSVPPSASPERTRQSAGATSPPGMGPGPQADGGDPPPDRYATVIALSRLVDHEANKKLLASRGYGLVVWNSLEKVERDLAGSSDICACLVDQSFLQAMDREAQMKLFELLAAYSTFLWIRVHDGDHLADDHVTIGWRIRAIRCARAPVPSELLSFQPSSALRDAELAEIDEVRALLRTHHDTVFTPGELTIAECHLLAAAARVHARELTVDGQATVESLEIRFLHGGQAARAVAMVRINGQGRPIVVKVASKAAVRDEIRRFQRFILPWDDQLRPQAFYHADAAVIVFGLVRDPLEPTRPATELEETLSALWNDELFGSVPAEEIRRRGDDLVQSLNAAAHKLGELNRHAPGSSGYTAELDPDVRPLDRLAAQGVDWGFGDDGRRARSFAVTRVAAMAGRAVVHGDMHLRNVLVRGPADVHLIDYAGSGPGHPAVDLVRLEMSLFLDVARQVESAERCVELQRCLSIGRQDRLSLAAAFPEFHRCQVNAVSLAGCIAARDEVLAVLTHYGGDQRDYLAMKYLVAWQSLIMMKRHAGLTRTVIEALTPTVLQG
jgi:hypothetical protein